MKDINYLELIYTHRSEMASGGFRDLLKKDTEYQKALVKEQLAEKECDALGLTEGERDTLDRWGDEAHNESGMYAKAAYRMGMAFPEFIDKIILEFCADEGLYAWCSITRYLYHLNSQKKEDCLQPTVSLLRCHIFLFSY